MKLEIDDETVDGIIVASLTNSIELLEGDIKRLEKKKKRKLYESEDLAYALVDLDALKRARHYYGGEDYK